eukprot:m.198420 g.198420  ORF g.198420 m.198420 type:complete len:995 (+) comp32694_c0_seq1:183-3167(+)
MSSYQRSAADELDLQDSDDDLPLRRPRTKKGKKAKSKAMVDKSQALTTVFSKSTKKNDQNVSSTPVTPAAPPTRSATSSPILTTASPNSVSSDDVPLRSSKRRRQAEPVGVTLATSQRQPPSTAVSGHKQTRSTLKKESTPPAPIAAAKRLKVQTTPRTRHTPIPTSPPLSTKVAFPKVTKSSANIPPSPSGSVDTPRACRSVLKTVHAAPDTTATTTNNNVKLVEPATSVVAKPPQRRGRPPKKQTHPPLAITPLELTPTTSSTRSQLATRAAISNTNASTKNPKVNTPKSQQANHVDDDDEPVVNTSTGSKVSLTTTNSKNKNKNKTIRTDSNNHNNTSAANTDTKKRNKFKDTTTTTSKHKNNRNTTINDDDDSVTPPTPPRRAPQGRVRKVPKVFADEDFASPSPLKKKKGTPKAVGEQPPPPPQEQQQQQDGDPPAISVDFNKRAPCADPRAYCSFCCELESPTKLLSCATCGNSGHKICLKFNNALWKRCKNEPEWHCIECKICAVCEEAGHDDLLLFCDTCDKGVHMYCNKPLIREMPEGEYACPECDHGSMHHDKPTSATLRTYGCKPLKKSKPNPKPPPPPSDAAGTKAETQSTPLNTPKGGDKSRSSKRLSVSDEPAELPPKLPRVRGPRGPYNKTKIRLAAEKLAMKSKTKNAKTKTKTSPQKVKREEGDPTVEDEKLYQAARTSATQRLAVERDMDQTDHRCIEIGQYQIRTWYSAPYPEEYAILPKLYLCEFCLKYMKSLDALERHQHKCDMDGHPPGTEIYRCGKLQMWEVDGNSAKIYCQNLCLLAKLFLDHKTLYYDVEPFRFYVLTLHDMYGSHFVGYFSKEKDSVLGYNVSCILTLPHMQRKGYGKFLIDFSYLLTRVEKKTGSPEKPLSALGELSYDSYWRHAIMDLLCVLNVSEISANDICVKTGMTQIDVINILKEMQLIKELDDRHVLVVDPVLIEKHREKKARYLKKCSPHLVLDETKLQWIPPAQRIDWD